MVLVQIPLLQRERGGIFLFAGTEMMSTSRASPHMSETNSSLVTHGGARRQPARHGASRTALRNTPFIDRRIQLGSAGTGHWWWGASNTVCIGLLNSSEGWISKRLFTGGISIERSVRLALLVGAT